MSEYPGDPATKALEFVSNSSTYVLLVTIALTAWVASGVEFTRDALRAPSMACLTLSAVFGIAALALIPLIQEVRQPGESNFDVDARFRLLGRRSLHLRAVLLPQYFLLLAGLVLYVIGA